MDHENTDRSVESGDGSGGGVERRRLLEAAGAASVPLLAGCQELDPRSAESSNPSETGTTDGTATPDDEAAESATLAIDPDLDLGGRLVVGAPDAIGYDTIQAAWEAAEDGDAVFVHSSYDAETAGEAFPIVLDYTKKEVMLSGGHPSGSIIDARHAPEKDVVEVLGAGHSDYRNKALVQHLKIRGGNVGLRIRGGTYSTYKDLIVYQANEDGVRVEGYVDSAGAKRGSYGVTFRNCMAWRNGGAGYRLQTGADPHATTFYGCHALFNGLESGAPGVALRGYASRWANGVVQNNGGFGIDARSGASQGVSDTYFEGNGMAQATPQEVYVSETSPGFVLKGSYFNGAYFRDAPNGRDRAARGVGISGAQGAELSACTFKNYTDAFLSLSDTTDADVHLATHTGLDDTRLRRGGGNERLRSSGLVLESDLRDGDPQGRYVCDYGVHDGSGDAPWGLAMWNGSRWVSVVDGTVVG
jgi:hypothetical protein